MRPTRYRRSDRSRAHRSYKGARVLRGSPASLAARSAHSDVERLAIHLFLYNTSPISPHPSPLCGRILAYLSTTSSAMTPLTYVALALAALSSVVAAPTGASEVASLEKRVTHSGRVCRSPSIPVEICLTISQGTFFNVGLGACGKNNVNSDHIVAISSAIFGSGGNCEQVRSAPCAIPTSLLIAFVFPIVHGDHKQGERQDGARSCPGRMPRMRRRGYW